MNRLNKCRFLFCFISSKKRLFISPLTRGIIKTIYLSKGLEQSCRRNIFFFTLSIAFLSLAHLIFSYFYIRMYGYFNLHGHLNSFMTAAWILRFIIDVYIVICASLPFVKSGIKYCRFICFSFYSISYFHLFFIFK